MKIRGATYQTIWVEEGDVCVIDQRFLPFRLVIERLSTFEQVVTAIAEMHVRGAPLIGVTAAFGVYFAVRELLVEHRAWDEKSRQRLSEKLTRLIKSRPTAVNLENAVSLLQAHLVDGMPCSEIVEQIKQSARVLMERELEISRNIGNHGLRVLKEISARNSARPLQVLTHCNAGWLATVDWGTATAPIYQAAREGVSLHVWVDETRPRLQGAKLTVFELSEEGIPCTLLCDSAAGFLMQQGRVDVCIVGADRVSLAGDVVNKVGTYLTALAAREAGVPFYVAVPSTSIDSSWTAEVGGVAIEERDPGEILLVEGRCDGRDEFCSVWITEPGVSAVNFAFDMTPAGLISGIITERGVCEASGRGIGRLFPEFGIN